MFTVCVLFLFFFFKQKTAYEMRISDWSSDVCSSDLLPFRRLFNQALFGRIGGVLFWQRGLLRLAWLFAASALAFRHWEFLRLCAARRVTPGLRNGVVEVGVPPVTIMILVCRRFGDAEALKQLDFFRGI